MCTWSYLVWCRDTLCDEAKFYCIYLFTHYLAFGEISTKYSGKKVDKKIQCNVPTSGL